jgi:hypothetical protein
MSDEASDEASDVASDVAAAPAATAHRPPLLARLARPKIGRHSAYTVLGFAGYGVAVVLGVALARRWQLPLTDRLVAFLVPPAAFLATVTVATALKGREWIVFYQALFAALAAVLAVGALAGVELPRLADLTVLGIGAFLAIGRLGCFRVACCHGRPLGPWAARRLPGLGVRYGAAHVALGFWARWQDRPLYPVQLIEAAASAGWVVAGWAGSQVPGRAAVIYCAGYAATRFALELVRGDAARPHAAGLSEAQWASLFSLLCAATVGLQVWTAALAAVTAAAAALLIAARSRRAFTAPAHLHELDRLAAAVLADPNHARRDSRLGIGLSHHRLPDGRRDWILSSAHPAWSPQVARRLAAALWPDAELIPGRTAGVVHVVEPGLPTAPAAAGATVAP